MDTVICAFFLYFSRSSVSISLNYETELVFLEQPGQFDIQSFCSEL